MQWPKYKVSRTQQHLYTCFACLSGYNIEQTFTRWCFQVLNANECVEQLQQFALLHEECLKINPFSKTDNCT